MTNLDDECPNGVNKCNPHTNTAYNFSESIGGAGSNPITSSPVL